MDLINRRIAMRKNCITDPTFRLFKMEVLTNDTILVEGSATTTFKTGKRAGQRKYFGPSYRAAITHCEQSAEFLLYEKETDNCSRCLGDGKLPSGRDKFRVCPRCGGTKKPPGLRNLPPCT